MVAPVLLVQPPKLLPEQALELFLADPGRLLEAGDEGREPAAEVGLLLGEIEEVAGEARRGGRRTHPSVEAEAVVAAPDGGPSPHAGEGGVEDERPERVVHQLLQRPHGSAGRDAHQPLAARYRGGAVGAWQVSAERVLPAGATAGDAHARSPDKRAPDSRVRSCPQVDSSNGA